MAIELSILCDVCGVRGASTQHAGRAAMEMRELLIKCGWQVGNGTGPDLCPEHVEVAEVPPRA